MLLESSDIGTKEDWVMLLEWSDSGTNEAVDRVV
jgi:hypothetical protein